MPAFTFEFNDGASTFATNTGVGNGITFTDDGITFSLSIAADGGNPGSFMRYLPSANGNDGSITMFDSSTNTAGVTMQLSVTGAETFTGAQVIDINGVATAPVVISYGGFTTTIPVGGENVFTIGNVGSSGPITFSMSNFSFVNLDSIQGNVTCYLTGTRIATPDGEVAVETLKAGDMVRTADGGTTRVQWLGVQPINAGLLHPAKANPVCIRKDALAPGVPHRDLFVTADHAMALDGLLVNAGALVNGRSIYQVARMPEGGFTYYHVETEAHELLLAEGAAAESFYDQNDRVNFVNAAEAPQRPAVAEMDLPRISTRRLVPDTLRAYLDARAEELDRKVA